MPRCEALLQFAVNQVDSAGDIIGIHTMSHRGASVLPFLHKHWMSDFCNSIHVVEFRSFFTEPFVKMTELQLVGDH